ARKIEIVKEKIKLKRKVWKTRPKMKESKGTSAIKTKKLMKIDLAMYSLVEILILAILKSSLSSGKRGSTIKANS
ncbi:MAG: hypothetical protein DRP00_02440, partial [Candidatus Aenigmatarchaeota archaeon]